MRPFKRPTDREVRDLKSQIGGLKARLAKAERGHLAEMMGRVKFERRCREIDNKHDHLLRSLQIERQWHIEALERLREHRESPPARS